jgi:hypothetical protein
VWKGHDELKRGKLNGSICTFTLIEIAQCYKPLEEEEILQNVSILHPWSKVQYAKIFDTPTANLIFSLLQDDIAFLLDDNNMVKIGSFAFRTSRITSKFSDPDEPFDFIQLMTNGKHKIRARKWPEILLQL